MSANSVRNGRSLPALSLGRKMRRLAFYCAITAILFVFLFPIYWTFTTSTKPESQAFSIPPVWLFRPTFDNYLAIFQQQSFGTYVLNSVTVTTTSTVLALLIGTPAAYGLSRFRFRGRSQIAFFILSSRITPPVLLMLPFFLLYQNLGLLGTTTWGLTVAYLTFNISLVVTLMANFFDDVPRELDEAALVDGASRWTTFVRVVLPLSRSGLATAAIFCVVFSWNEFLYAFILTGSETRTLPVLLTTFVRSTGTDWGKLTAAASFVMLPMLVLSFFVQRNLARGLTYGAVK